jgi:hypothetical protein
MIVKKYSSFARAALSVAASQDEIWHFFDFRVGSAGNYIKNLASCNAILKMVSLTDR